VRKINSPINVRSNFGRKVVHFRFSKTFSLECNSARPFLIIFIFFTVVFREKHGLVRNDFLDCMMELRQSSKFETQGDVQSAENANTGATYSKLQLSVIIEGGRTLGNIVFGLCCVVHNCPEFGIEGIFISDISLGSVQEFFEPMKRLKEPVNSDIPSNVIVYIFHLVMVKKKSSFPI